MIPETDEVLVNRNGNTYKTTAENMANLEDTDLMLVNRDGVTYTVTGEEIKDSIQAEEAPDITSVVLTQNQVNADRYTSNQFTSTVNYAKDPFPPASIQMTAKVEGVLGLEASTSDIISNDYVGTSSTSVPLELANNTFLNDGTFEVGDVVKASESYTPETDVIDEIIPAAVTSISTNMNYVAPNGTPFPNTAYDFNKAIYDGQSSITYQVNFNPGVDFNSTLKLAVDSSRPNEVITANFLNAGAVEVTNRLDGQNPFNINQIWVYNGNDTLLSVTFNGEYENNTGCGFRGIWFDDKEFTYVSGFNQIPQSGTVSDGPPYDSLKLASNKDINLFQVGDVVQQDTPYIGDWESQTFPSTSQTLEGDPKNIWNGNKNSAGNLVKSSSSDSGKIDFAPDLQLAQGQVLTMKYSLSGGGSVSANISVSSSAGTLLNDNTVDAGDQLFEYTVTQPEGITIDKIEASAGGSGDSQSGFVFIYYIAIDDEQLIQTGKATEVKVVDTDVSAKTITVDGGNWDTSNQSQVWSYGTVTEESNNGFYAGSGPDKAFDGDLTTQPNTSASNNNGNITWTLSPPLAYTSSVRAYSNGNVSGTYSFNGGSATSYGSGWITLATGSGSLASINTNRDGDGFFFSAIEVDGKLLIDAVEDSQVWSNNTIGTASSGYEWVNGFNGLETTPGVNSNSATVPYAVVFDPPLSGTLLVKANTGGEYVYSTTENPNINNDTHWIRAATSNLITPSAAITAIGAFSSPQLLSVEIDGKLLVDKGVRDLGDNKVSIVSPKQGQGTISDITGSVVTINPYTDNCFKEGQYLTHATPKPILITPQTDDITDVTGDVLTFSGDKDLLNFVAGDAVSMVNADGSAATYNATTSAITNVDPQSITGSSSGWSSGGANLYNGTGGTASTSNGSGTRAGSVSFNPALPAGTSQISYYEYNGSSGSTRPMTVTISYDDATSDVINTQISAGNTRVHPVDSAKQIKSISWSADVANESLNINQLKLDLNVIDLSDYDQTVLTFTDNTNLQYWKDGEVVGGYQGTISGTNSVGTGIFNFATYPYETKTFTQIFDPPVPCTSFQFRARPTDGQESMESKISINGGGFTSITQGDVQTNYNVPSGLTSLTYKFVVQAGNTHFGPGFGQLRFDGGDLDDIGIVDSTTFTWKVVTVIGNPDLVNNTITVSGGSWSNGDTLAKSISGTGTVLTTSPQNSTMTLSANNGEWVDGYYVQTPEKPVIGQIGYLKFGSNGNVTGVTLAPQPAVVMANPNPVLTFPAQFGTGETPDTELPYPTSLQTTITASNTFIDLTVNTSTASSNVLFPATTTFLGPASGTSRYTGTGVAQLTANLTTFSGREAAANTDPTDVQGALAAKQTEIDDYIAGL